MTKNDLVTELCDRSTLTRSQAIHAIEGLMEIMGDAFAQGNNIYLRGFGTFKIVRRKAKTARNIGRGTAVDIPAHNAVKFIPCVELKNRVR